MKETKEGNAPLDATDTRLLLDAIKELNISKRNVSLYPRDHPQTKESMGRAFNFLRKLFESRGSLTLGVAKDALMIDDTPLSKKILALKEFALTLHHKGIASVTLPTTLKIEELFGFHELLTARETATGAALVELAREKGLGDIELTPLDISKVRFVEGSTREEGGGDKFWEEYVSALLDGRLTEEDMEDVVHSLSAEEMAQFIIKSAATGMTEKAYDAVIAAYLGGSRRPSPALFGKFLAMVDSLTPALKEKFLSLSFSSRWTDALELKQLLRELTFADIRKMMKVFDEQSSLLPEKLQTLVEKMKQSKTDLFMDIQGGSSYIDDIEVNEKIVSSFKKDHDGRFMDQGYREELKRMLENQGEKSDGATIQLEEACRDEVVDKAASRIVFALLSLESTSGKEYRELLSNLTGFVTGFVETGRFSDIAEIHRQIYSHSLEGPFREEAAATIKGFFGSPEFLRRLIAAFRIWGRHSREEVFGLAVALKDYSIPFFLDALTDERDESMRKFFLDALCRIGGDVAPEAARRLDDNRWYVVRNMIYLIRECNGSQFVKYVRPFTRHHEKKVVIETLKTLLHFRTPDSLSLLKLYLGGKDPSLRELAVRLSGMYKVKEAVPYLVELLEKRDLFGSKSSGKTVVVDALADIGEPDVLKTLFKICRANALLSRAESDRLKIEIFRSLHRYPFQEARPLLEFGLKSRNREIRSLSEKILHSGGGSCD
jgi:HEAT repeat protein